MLFTSGLWSELQPHQITWNGGPQHQFTILRREADLSASAQANLFS